MSNDLIDAGTLDDLKRKGVTVVRAGGYPIAVYYHDGRVSAVDNRCPHMGFPLHKGTVKDGILTCHWHQARFDLCSGCTFDLWADDVLPFDVVVKDGRVFVAPAPRVQVDSAYHRRRFEQGLRQNISLVQAKSILGLLDSGSSMKSILRDAAEYGSRHHDMWASGMTMLTIVLNLLPILSRETAYFAAATAVSQLADDCSGVPPRQPREALEHDEYPPELLRRWLLHWTKSRHRDAAERTVLTAASLAPEQFAELMYTAASERPFADGGHLFDFTNKMFELTAHLGAATSTEFAPLLMNTLVRARGGEESAHWHHPVDLLELLHGVEEKLPELMRVGAGRTYSDDPALREQLLGDDPVAIIEGLARAISKGAAPRMLARDVAYAAAMRLARFAVTNDVSDWFGPLHTFIYANAVHEALGRASSPSVVRAVFHGAMSVYLDRFLNMPPAKLPGERGSLDDLPTGAEELRERLLATLDQRAEIDAAARVAVRYLRLGHSPAELFDTLVFAAVREDIDFHALQVIEAGVRQFAEWEGRPEAEHIVVGVVRNLAAVCPTRRGALQTATIALRLHRQEKVYEE